MYIICLLIPSSCYCIEYSLIFVLWKWHMRVTHWNRCSCMILMWTVRKIFQHKFQCGKVVNKFQQIKSLLNEKNCIKMNRNWMKQMLSLDIPPKNSLHLAQETGVQGLLYFQNGTEFCFMICWHMGLLIARGSKHIQKELVPLLLDRLTSMPEAVRLPLAMTHLQGYSVIGSSVYF